MAALGEADERAGGPQGFQTPARPGREPQTGRPCAVADHLDIGGGHVSPQQAAGRALGCQTGGQPTLGIGLGTRVGPLRLREEGFPPLGQPALHLVDIEDLHRARDHALVLHGQV
ncbi:MAG: hypothetical protein DMF79_12415 [Acidobacteria bacterium]|nr:MAG: hypothetical protein DMF79_12415 [Acidobacteriota bacterium]